MYATFNPGYSPSAWGFKIVASGVVEEVRVELTWALDLCKNVALVAGKCAAVLVRGGGSLQLPLRSLVPSGLLASSSAHAAQASSSSVPNSTSPTKGDGTSVDQQYDILRGEAHLGPAITKWLAAELFQEGMEQDQDVMRHEQGLVQWLPPRLVLFDDDRGALHVCVICPFIVLQCLKKHQ